MNRKFKWFENGDEDKDRKYVGEIKVKGKAHPVKTYQVKNLISGKDEKEIIEYETDGFSLVLEKNEIKSKKEIINYLKKSID